MADENKDLNSEELVKVSGGTPIEEENITDEASEYCHGEYENGRHKWVRTGNHKEKDLIFNWTWGSDEFKCTKCGAVKWEHV